MKSDAPHDNREEILRSIRDDVVNLTSSPLYIYRTENNYFPVIGQGSHTAHLMFIGEAPGRNEAQTGRPFCGAAGKILDELCASIDLKRDDVYITNILKDRPPNNRDPLPEEIELYAPFLDRQIEAIKPRVIATLGRFSMAYIMKKFGLEKELGSISKIHGHVFETHSLFAPAVVIIPLYHPAASIYDQSLKQTLLNDFQIIKKYI
jgi:DNA polymerase